MIDARAPRPPIAGTATQLAEARISQFCADFVDHGARLLRTEPVRAVRVLIDLRRLPRIDAAVGGTREGELIRRSLLHSSWPKRVLTRHAVSVLRVPERAADYRLGSGRQTLRRKIRQAQALGVRCVPVTGETDRRALLALAASRERQHPLPQHRYDSPDLEHLLEIGLWLVALDSSDDPVAFSATPLEGQWALVTYCRSLQDTEAGSTARYLITEQLVVRLAELGVRWLLEEHSPFGLPNGLRHFQRMLGWRITRVRVLPRRQGSVRRESEPAVARTSAT